MEPAHAHIHVEGGVGSGKTHLLQATFHELVRLGHRAVFLDPDYFAGEPLGDLEHGQWFFIDQLESFSADQQRVLMAWLAAALANQCRVFTAARTPWFPETLDLHSRLQAALQVQLSLPESMAQWELWLNCVLRRHQVRLPTRRRQRLVRALLENVEAGLHLLSQEVRSESR